MRTANAQIVRVALLVTCMAIAACAGASTTPDNFLGGSSGSKRASGRVSIAISIDGSATRTNVNQTERRSELAQVDLAFDLGEIDGGPGAIFYWQDAKFGGTLSWYSEHITTGPPPGGVGPNPCISGDSLLQSFSSAGAGGQPGAVKLEVEPSGRYNLWIWMNGPTGPTQATQIFMSNCNDKGTMGRTVIPSSEPYVPLTNYFNSAFWIPVNGGVEYFSGSIAPGANRVNNVVQTTDTYLLFHQTGTPDVTVPVVIRLTWDFTLK
jgi:hypothetical protein